MNRYEDGHAPEPLTEDEAVSLNIFDHEVARGLVHRPEYEQAMAELRARRDGHREHGKRNDASAD